MSQPKALEKHCEMRDHLFSEYRQRVREWVASINTLHERSDYLEDLVEEKRFRALLARNQYLNHIADHHCSLFKPRQ